MKKLIALLLSLLAFTSLISCNNSDKPKEMEIKRAVLTEEESNIALLFGTGSNYEVYDYKTSDKIKSITIKRYSLDKDKKWQEVNKTLDVCSSPGRILIALDKSHNLIYSKVINDGGNSTTIPTELDYSQYNGSSGISQNDSPIVADEEIPLFIKAFKKEGSQDVFDFTSFKNPEILKNYDDAILITITFSEKQK